jgi:hypothetical protein
MDGSGSCPVASFDNSGVGREVNGWFGVMSSGGLC